MRKTFEEIPLRRIKVGTLSEYGSGLLNASTPTFSCGLVSDENREVFRNHVPGVLECDPLISLRELNDTSCHFSIPTISEPNVGPDSQVTAVRYVLPNIRVGISIDASEGVGSEDVILCTQVDIQGSISHELGVSPVGWLVIGQPDHQDVGLSGVSYNVLEPSEN